MLYGICLNHSFFVEQKYMPQLLPMKALLIQILLSVFILGSCPGQSFVGRWHLRGKAEMAAGFDFRPDSTFQFYFSYGASDRVAKGTWKAKGDTVFLKSNKPPGKDFSILKQSAGGKEFHIRVVDKNPLLVDQVRCYAFAGGSPQIFESDRQGEIHIPWQQCDSLYLQHPMFPDIASRIMGKNNPNRNFEVGLQPSLMEVSFKGILFWRGDDGHLHCHMNYFMPMENIRFEKEE